MADVRIVPILGARVSISDTDWKFARTHCPDIEKYWQYRKSKQPQLFNGEVLLLNKWSIQGDLFRGECLRTDFKSFLFWREHDAPDRDVMDFCAAAALHSREGSLVLGRMSIHHSSPGLVYMPSGTLHPSDLDGSAVDLDGSILREVQEETGLVLNRGQLGAGLLIFDEWRLVLVRPVKLPQLASEVSLAVAHHLRAVDAPELDDVVVIRSAVDTNAAMPPYVIAYINRLFPPSSPAG